MIKKKTRSITRLKNDDQTSVNVKWQTISKDIDCALNAKEKSYLRDSDKI